jgi:hypothetical protein
MAKVYLSSTVLDLKDERRAVSDWLIAADHQPVHSYVADSETVRDSCLDDIARCDLYVLLLGHRYGYVPARDNPDGLSITHLEFRRAGELGLPRIALMRTSVPDINHSDLLDPERNRRLQAFHAEVRQTLRPAEFSDEADLIAALSAAVPRALRADTGAGQDRRPGKPPPSAPPPQPRPAMPPSDKGGWWTTLPGLLTGAAALITAVGGLFALFVGGEEKASPTPAPSVVQAGTANPPVAAPAPTPAQPGPATSAPPRVALAGPAEVSFDKYRPSTYSILGIETQPRTPTHYGLRLKVRLLTRTSMDMNFWDSAFRLVIDGVPSAPDSNLNLLVPGNAALDGEVIFQVPYAARALMLRVIHHDSLGEVADLPLRIDADAAANMRTNLQPGQ